MFNVQVQSQFKNFGQDKSKQFLKTKTLLVPPAGEKSLATAPPSWFQTSASQLPRASVLMADGRKSPRIPEMDGFKWEKNHQKHQPIKQLHQTWGYDYPIIAQTFAIYALSFSDDLIWLDGNVWLLTHRQLSLAQPARVQIEAPGKIFWHCRLVPG